MVILETPRLVLRRLEPSDLEALFALYRDPEVRRYFPDGTLTREETKEELEWFLHGHPQNPKLGLWATLDRKSEAFLGRCGLLPWEIEGKSEIELAFLIDKAQWGCGVATEVAEAIKGYAQRILGLQRLICLVMPGNSASVRVAEKVGMSFERELQLKGIQCHVYSCTLNPASDA
jgi:ribosomal-protein-alanine N-acetyltransferase